MAPALTYQSSGNMGNYQPPPPLLTLLQTFHAEDTQQQRRAEKGIKIHIRDSES